MKTWVLLTALLGLACPAFSGAIGELSALTGAEARAFRMQAKHVAVPAEPERKLCPEGWREARKGGCWTKSPAIRGKALSYVHPRGWAVSPSCFKHPAFSAEELMAALEKAYRKMSPAVPVRSGGCLSSYNPEWGKKLVNDIWDEKMVLTCPEYGKEELAQTDTCAQHYKAGAYSVISVKDIKGCMGKDSSGLSGVMFHESLHASGADNFATAKHNKAWRLPQMEWVRDRVYGAEAVCYFGVHPGKRKAVNLFQCFSVVRYMSSAFGENPREKLCDGYEAYFTDRPPSGFMRH